MNDSTHDVESHLRSVAKGVSYRCVGSLATVVISFVMTGSVRTASLIGSAEVVTKVLIFWGHERLWHRIPWGRRRRAWVAAERLRSSRPPAPAPESVYALHSSETTPGE